MRLVEVKQLRTYLETMLPPEEAGKAPTVADAPEVALGIFALKVMKKTEVVRLKQVGGQCEAPPAPLELASRASLQSER